jgi:hypothetical protein
MADYSLVPSAQQQMGSWGQPNMNLLGQMPQAPQMLDYSFGQTGAMPVAGMNGGTGLTMGGAGGYGGMSSWGAGAGAGNSLGSGFGMNMPTLALGLQGLNSLGSLYMGSKSLSLANKQFESAQKFANINLANQTKSYNDTLENKIKRIGSFNGTSSEDTAAEYERRKLTSQA